MTQFKNVTLGLAITLLASAPALASSAADVSSRTTCTGKIAGQNIEVVSVETEGQFAVTLTADGKEVPSLRGSCFYSDRPSTRYVLCAYQIGKTRIDFYPWVQTVSGMIKTNQYIVTTDGKQGAPSKFASCTK